MISPVILNAHFAVEQHGVKRVLSGREILQLAVDHLATAFLLEHPGACDDAVDGHSQLDDIQVAIRVLEECGRCKFPPSAKAYAELLSERVVFSVITGRE